MKLSWHSFLCFSLSLASISLAIGVHKPYVSDPSYDESITVGNSLVTFEFANATGGFGLKQITTLQGPNPYSFLLPSTNSSLLPALWDAQFRDSEGQEYDIDSNVASVRSYTRDISDSGVIIRFYWKYINLGYTFTNTNTSVEVIFTLNNDTSLGTFEVIVNNPRDSADKPCLWYIDFINVNNIGVTKGFANTSALHVPFTVGTSFSPASDAWFQSAYPAGDYSMQFMAWCQTRDCLYYATHDSFATYKMFQFTNDWYLGISQHTPLSQISVRNIPPNACSSMNGTLDEVYTVPYAVTVGPYLGDWWDASQFYRNWAIPNADWTSPGPLSQRDDIPLWFLETPLWINTGWEPEVLNWTNGDPQLVVSRMKAIMSLFDLTTVTLHWYCWNQSPFDSNYPEYLPAREGFEEGLRTLQDMGVKVFPYINGRLFDYNAVAWETDNAQDFTAKRSAPRLNPLSLQMYSESYGSQQEFATMCPYTEYWQQKISGIVDELVNDYGVDGMYIDQIGAAGPYECHDPSHGHTIGGGDYWYTGYKQLLADSRNAANRKKLSPIVTESCAEPWLGSLQGYLVIAQSCPYTNLLSAVYGGYMTPFGEWYYPTDFVDPNWLTIRTAQMFLAGAQLGWFSMGGSIGVFDLLIQPQYEPQIGFIKTLIAYRKLAMDYLVYGRLMRDLFSIGSPIYNVENKCKIPTVNVAAWLAEDGLSLVILAPNPLDKMQTLDISLTLSDYGLIANTKYDVSLVSPNQNNSLGSWTNSFNYTKTVGAFDVIMLLFQTNE